jgi:hypothetical protein
MCKEMSVIPVNKVVDPKRIFGKKWRAKEEERHKGLLTPKKSFRTCVYNSVLLGLTLKRHLIQLSTMNGHSFHITLSMSS